AAFSSLSKYSGGTSSSDTSRVLTSETSGGLAPSTPSTTSASKALPSSINSSTLSEAYIGTLSVVLCGITLPPVLEMSVVDVNNHDIGLSKQPRHHFDSFTRLSGST